MNKLLISAVGMAILITVTAWFSYKAGVNSEIASGVKVIAEYQEKERQVIKELEKAKKNREVVIREKIKIIRQVVDVCASRNAPNSILQQFTAHSTP